MIGIFCFDGPLYKDKNGKYCSLTVTNEMISRYKNVTSYLYIFIRVFPIDSTFKDMHMSVLKLDNIEVIELPNYYSLTNFFKKSKSNKIIDKYIQKADLIFGRLPGLTANVVLERAIKYKKYYLAEVGGCSWDSMINHGLKGKILAPYVYYLQKKYVKNSSYCSYVTDKFLQRRYPNDNKKSLSCSNVYIEIEDEAIEKRIDKLNVSGNKIIMGTSSNSIDVKYKGHDSVLKALWILKKHGYTNFEYQIAGPGEGKYLKKIIRKYNLENQVIFTGSLTKLEIIEWLDLIDIYIQPSKQEGLPRSVIEAMSRGCFCLGTTVAGIPELLSKEHLFKPGDSKKIAGLIIKYMSSSRDYKKKVFIDNFNRSKQYEKKLLEIRRKNFFDEYIKMIQSN